MEARFGRGRAEQTQLNSKRVIGLGSGWTSHEDGESQQKKSGTAHAFWGKRTAKRSKGAHGDESVKGKRGNGSILTVPALYTFPVRHNMRQTTSDIYDFSWADPRMRCLTL